MLLCLCVCVFFLPSALLFPPFFSLAFHARAQRRGHVNTQQDGGWSTSQEKRPENEAALSSALILNFLVSRTLRNVFLLFKPCSLWYFVRADLASLSWWLSGKESTCNAGNTGLIPGSGRFLGKGNGNHSSILAQKIPWTEEPGGLPTIGSPRVRDIWATNPQSISICWKMTLCQNTFLTVSEASSEQERQRLSFAEFTLWKDGWVGFRLSFS